MSKAFTKEDSGDAPEDDELPEDQAIPKGSKIILLHLVRSALRRSLKRSSMRLVRSWFAQWLGRLPTGTDPRMAIIFMASAGSGRLIEGFDSSPSVSKRPRSSTPS